MKRNLILYKSFACKIIFFRGSVVKRNYRSMSYAYLRYVEGSDRFQFSFNFEYKHVNRQFNFNRLITESLNDFLFRISTNVGKAIDKKKKKSKEVNVSNLELEHSSKLSVCLFKDGVPLPPEMKCGDILCQVGMKLLVCDRTYEIQVNAPWVNSLVLPDSILTEFPVYPSKIELEFASRDDSSFVWFKSMDDKRNQFSWSKAGEGFFYTPSSSEIGTRLRVVCIPRKKMCIEGEMYREGPSVEAISPTVVEAGPGTCPFEVRHSFTPERVSEGSFRVVSYNILADTYVDSDFSRNVLYPYCPPYALAINYRKQLLLKELIGYNADLMCLQEVDAKVFEFDLTPVLSSVGFSGVFQRKGDGRVNEGLACFFHKTKFKLITSSSLTIGKEITTNPIFSKLHAQILLSFPDPSKLLAQLSDLPTTVQVTVLEVIEKDKKEGQRLVVGVTHLYFHPLADNIRLLQTGMALTYLEHIVDQESKSSSQRATLILCGDFNSTPEFGVVRFITSGKVNPDDPDWSSGKEDEMKKTSPDFGKGDPEHEVDQLKSQFRKRESEEAVKGLLLSHHFPLASAYGELDFTNYTSGFVGCLDYIFYSTDTLKVDQVVPLPSEEEVSQNTALPSIVFPSDHLALVADLSWNT